MLVSIENNESFNSTATLSERKVSLKGEKTNVRFVAPYQSKIISLEDSAAVPPLKRVHLFLPPLVVLLFL